MDYVYITFIYKASVHGALDYIYITFQETHHIPVRLSLILIALFLKKYDNTC